MAYADSLRYSSGFFSNVYFEKVSGYFASSTSTKPLLHFWSLAIEEQFYIFYPIVLITLFKFLPRMAIPYALLLIFFSSGFYSWYLTGLDPDAAYYSLFSRGGELLLGGLIALFSTGKHDKTLPKQMAYLAGFVGISTLSFLLFTIDKNSTFPGVNAYWVGFATGLILLAARHTDTYLHATLSSRPLVTIGQYSFSLYLWHWPIQCFYQYYYGPLDSLGIGTCFTLTVFLSFLSKKLIEDPFRYAKIKTPWVFIFYLLIPLICLVAIAKFTKKENGFPSRFDASAQTYFTEVKKEFVSSKMNNSIQGIKPDVIGDESNEDIQAFLWGDSHARHYKGFVDQLGKTVNFSALQDGSDGCPPITDIQLVRYGKIREFCHDKNQEILQAILDSKVKFVFFAARWAYYLETKGQENENLVDPFFIDKLDDTISKENTQRAIKLRFFNMIETLISAGIQPVIIGQIPDLPFNPVECVFKSNIFESYRHSHCHADKVSFDKRYHSTEKLFAELRVKFPTVLFIEPKSLLVEGDKYITNINKMSLYSDDDHINLHGALYLFDQYKKTPEYLHIKQALKETI